jgi:hypothetical protein
MSGVGTCHLSREFTTTTTTTTTTAAFMCLKYNYDTLKI